MYLTRDILIVSRFYFHSSKVSYDGLERAITYLKLYPPLSTRAYLFQSLFDVASVLTIYPASADRKASCRERV